MKTKEEIFDEYMQAALTGLLANPWLMKKLGFKYAPGAEIGEVISEAARYAKTAIELRNKLQLD